MTHKKINPNSENGQSMVEFAVSMVIIMILLAGIVDVGRALFTYMSIRDAAQEGALYGSVNPPENPSDTGRIAAIKARVFNSSNMLQDLLNTPGDPVQVTVSVLGSPCSGNRIQVQVDYEQFPLSMPFLGTVIGSQTIGIQASVIENILTPACP
jgi:Flp pilus assembly protein TadG